MPAFRAVVSVLLRVLGDVSLHPQAAPCGRICCCHRIPGGAQASPLTTNH